MFIIVFKHSIVLNYIKYSLNNTVSLYSVVLKNLAKDLSAIYQHWQMTGKDNF